MKGSQIKKRLPALGISMKELAGRLNISQQNMGRYLNESDDVRTGFMESVCDALDVDYAYFSRDGSTPEHERALAIGNRILRVEDVFYRNGLESMIIVLRDGRFRLRIEVTEDLKGDRK